MVPNTTRPKITFDNLILIEFLFELKGTWNHEEISKNLFKSSNIRKNRVQYINI